MKFNTPKDIMNYSHEQILDLIEDNDPRVKVKKKQRLFVIEQIYKALGLDLSPDLLLALLYEGPATLIVATAGSGKTTNSQVKVLLEKLFRRDNDGKPLNGLRILCLVYNKSNVEPMKVKQKNLLRQVNAKLTGFDIDYDINAKTMHSFCEEWKKQYIAKLDLFSYTLLEEWESESMISSLIGVLSKSLNVNLSKLNIKDVLQLYNLTHECLLSYEEMDKTQKFAELNTDKEILIKLFMGYDNMKRIRRKYDFIDMLTKFHNLLKSDEEVREFVQNYYQYIIADEIQDFTPIMLDILRLISGEKTPVLCVGDEDQCIYGFKGADIDTTLKFSDNFPGGHIYSLGINRRSGDKIVQASKYLVEHNVSRFPKVISSSKDGGVINYIPVNNQDEQARLIVKSLAQVPLDKLDDTMICYRDKNSSLKISYLLSKADIPYHILSGYDAYSHELFGHIIDVLNILESPYDANLQLKLYKCTGFTREEIKQIIDRNQARLRAEKGVNGDIPMHFLDMEYGEKGVNEKFLITMEKLAKLSNKIDSSPLTEIFPEVFTLLKTFFWNWKKQINKSNEIDNYFEDLVKEEFNVDVPFNVFMNDYNRKKRLRDAYNTSRTGVALGTFHVLKGLEYDTVHIIDLQDEIFPCYSKIESQGFDPKKELSLKESEVRLFFVAMTRAKNTLNLYYDKKSPSIYVKWLLAWEQENKSKVTVKAANIFNALDDTNRKVSNNIGLEMEDDDLIIIDDDDLENTLKIEDTEDDELIIEDKESKPNNPSPQVTSSSFLDSILDKF